MVELNDANSVPFPGIEGLKGYITVSGQPLPVHAIEQLGQKTVAYVESVSGAHFEVHVKDERREATDGKQFVVYLFADGEYVTGATIQEQRFYFHQPQDHKQRTLDFVGKRVSATSKAPLLFSSLRTTDDVDAACTDDRFLQDVGSIQLRYCRIKNVKERKKDPSRDSFSGSPAASTSKAPIFEGTKKGTALSHQTAYGEAKTDIKTGSNDFEPIDHKGAPLSTLVFRQDRQLIRSWKTKKQWDQRHMYSKRSFTWRGRTEDATSVRHFVFAPLSLVSDADEATSFTEAGLKALGSIELRIWRGRVVGAAPSPEDEGGEEGEKALPEIGGKAIWEQSKKLETGKHQAGLGPARPSFDTAPRASFEFVAELDPVETPWISFEWRYKDRASLETDGHNKVAPDNAAASGSGLDARAPSIKPKINARNARTDSPVLLYPNGRSPSSGLPSAPPDKPALDAKGKGKAVEAEEKPLKKRRTSSQPKPLGSITLGSSSDEDDMYSTSNNSSRRASTSKPLASASKPKPPPSPKLPPPKPASTANDVDTELARLRAELALYKQRELEQLRLERDAVKARVEGPPPAVPPPASPSHLKQAPKQEEMILSDDDDSATVAEGLLSVRKGGKEEGGATKGKERPGLPRKRTSEVAFGKAGRDGERKKKAAVVRELQKEQTEVLMLSDSESE